MYGVVMHARIYLDQENRTARWGVSPFGGGNGYSKIVEEEDLVANYFPWHVVERSRRDPQLQRYHGVKEEYIVEARSCPKCETPPERLRWVYVREGLPPSGQISAHGCREGYLLICDACLLQVDFFCEKRR
jgi:hypothetical protein